jgi:hypothetical protein
MNTTQKFGLPIAVIVLAILSLFTNMHCEKNFPPGTLEIDKLPPFTQIGAEKFGCLVDGKAFYPKGSIGAPAQKQASYQWVDNVQYFSIGVSQKLDNSTLKALNISSKELELEQKTYAFGAYGTPGVITGRFFVYKDDPLPDKYLTDPSLPGEITITRFDPIEHIISGTFWFDAINKDGKVVQVREGRFDANFVL